MANFNFLALLSSFQGIICGKVGLAPVQKILRNGRTVSIFTVGTGGLYDQRTIGAKDLPKPAQWHRISVHNEPLGAYAVQQLTKKYFSALLLGISLILALRASYLSHTCI